MSWQTIDSAPKMKNIILFAVTDIGKNGETKNWLMASGFWHTGYENDMSHSPWAWEGRQRMKYEVQPTHWCPLPDPPEAT